MRLSTRLFSCLLLVSLSVGSGLLVTTKRFIRERARETYISKYSLLLGSLGNTLSQLESNAETLMYSAAKVVAMEDNHKQPISEDHLKRLRDELKVTHLFVIDESGNFIRSTNENPQLIPNLFSFCPKYSQLITGLTGRMGTPIIPPSPEPQPYKFLTVPNRSRSRLIEVGLRVDFIAHTLSKVLEADSSIVDLSLFAPNGTSLGRFNREKFDVPREKSVMPTQLPLTREAGDHYELLTRVSATQTQCCQCDIAGITKSGEYYYTLSARISKSQLELTLASVDRFFYLLMGISVIFSIITSKILTTVLVRRLEAMVAKVDEIKNSSDRSARLRPEGSDEVADLAKSFNSLLDNLHETQDANLKSRQAAAIGHLAQQVSHDIRSPLAALEIAVKGLHSVPEDTRLLVRQATTRIRDIANNLLQRVQSVPDSRSPSTAQAILLPSILDKVIAEKRTVYRSKPNVEIEFQLRSTTFGLFATVIPSEISRVISNLVNNGVESLDGNGKVTVELGRSGSDVLIEITDTGKGIPSELIPMIGTQGMTFGKEHGSGLGVFHAKTVLARWGGKLEYQSKAGHGTTARIFLPMAAPPHWFVPSLEIGENTDVAIVDDDSSIHQVWKERLKEIDMESAGVADFHFFSPLEFSHWISTRSSNSDLLCLSDFEFMESMETGLEMISRLGLKNRALLVTSHSEDKDVVSACEALSVRLLPKALAAIVPILLVANKNPGLARDLGGSALVRESLI
jgi:signal transduction histidine kinase